MAKEGDALFKEGAFRRLNLEAYIVKAGENNVQSLQKLLFGHRWFRKTRCIRRQKVAGAFDNRNGMRLK